MKKKKENCLAYMCIIRLRIVEEIGIPPKPAALCWSLFM